MEIQFTNALNCKRYHSLRAVARSVFADYAYERV